MVTKPKAKEVPEEVNATERPATNEDGSVIYYQPTGEAEVASVEQAADPASQGEEAEKSEGV